MDQDWKPRDVARLLSLVEAEKRYYQEIMALLPVPVAILDETLTIQAANRALRRILWLESENLQQAALETILPIPGLADAAREVLLGRDRLSTRIVDLKTVAGVRQLRITMLPFRGWDDASAPELLLVAEDLSDARALAAGDAAVSRELQVQSEKDRALKRLAGQVVHDCNNLLMILTGHGEELLLGLPADSTQRNAVLEILEASRRLSGMTERLLAFTRRPRLEAAPFDLNASIRKIAEELSLQLHNHVEVEMKLGADVGPVAADREHIEDVLRVLTARARDAMPEGGHLTIETSRVELHEGSAETAGGMAPGAYVQVSVIDSGPAMDREAINRLFEPALGVRGGRELDIVYAVLRGSDGDLLAAPTPGGGNAIRFFLPLAPEVQTAPAPAAKATILVVDDEAGIRSLMRRVLQREGYNVIEAGDGEQAMALCESRVEPVDLLLTDVVMPHMGGYELVEKLRPLRPEMKVLCVSGYTGQASPSLPEGAGFLQKPFTLEALIGKVREVLGSR